jgi:uncharacterized protein (TIGR01777 family)
LWYSVFNQGRKLHIIVTGGTGFIGQALVPFLLQQGQRVTVLTRQAERLNRDSGPALDYINSLDAIDDEDGIDVIVNLAGEPIAGKRWSNSQKDKLIQSRVQTTGNVITLIHRLHRKPSCLVSASAVGFYGARGDEVLDENSGFNNEFSHQLCQQWEEAANQACQLGVRVCIVRLGIVLGKGGGALARMLPGFRIGLGGRLGSGSQYMSWIGIDDVVSAIDFLIRNPQQEGVFNVTAPEPVTNSEFTKTLGRVLSRPTIVAMPGAVVRILFGEMGDRLLLHGQRVIPSRLLENGFGFADTDLEKVLRSSVQ